MTLDLVRLRNFKCFDAADVPLAPLTLLTGFNAGGKSTTLQALLLLSQGLRVAPLSRFLPLNGPMVHLGAAADVIRSGSRGSVQFEVEGFGSSLGWELGAVTSAPDAAEPLENASERQRLEVERAWVNGEAVPSIESLHLVSSAGSSKGLRNALRDLIFLGATRHARLDIFPSPDAADPIFADVGHEGQYAPWWYVQCADNLVEEARRHPADTSITVRAQVDAWLNHLFAGAAANAESLPHTGMCRLQFKMRRSGWTRPNNIGFGLSYAFPLIVALLTARRGQTIIVDSPEAHLHPRAQSRMGQMLATFAASGVQIIVETHSDHILSGTRIAVQNRIIESHNTFIHFFSGQTDENNNGIITPTIDSDGRLSDWPEGFFDQSEIDLSALSGL